MTAFPRFAWIEKPGSPPVPESSGYAEQRRARFARVLDRMEEKDRIANARRVSRDPCPRCGVRGDIGCKHRRVA